jgi:hypothetical protein
MGAILSDAQLQRMSDLIFSLAGKDTATIRREIFTDDGQGGRTSTWQDVDSQPCILTAQPANREVMLAGQAIGRVYKSCLLPRHTDVRDEDVLVIAGITYKVLDILDPTTYEAARRVVVERQIG